MQLAAEMQATNNRQAIKTFVDELNHSELRMTLRLTEFDNIAEAITQAAEIKTRITSSVVFPLDNLTCAHSAKELAIRKASGSRLLQIITITPDQIVLVRGQARREVLKPTF